eukprot:319857-Chlamydomonas_euryale.AAC.6
MAKARTYSTQTLPLKRQRRGRPGRSHLWGHLAAFRLLAPSCHHVLRASPSEPSRSSRPSQGRHLPNTRRAARSGMDLLKRTIKGQGALHAAVASGDLAKVQRAVQKAPDVDVKDNVSRGKGVDAGEEARAEGTKGENTAWGSAWGSGASCHGPSTASCQLQRVPPASFAPPAGRLNPAAPRGRKWL